MGSFLESLGDTAKSIGGAASAPLGVVWDLASTPFDGEDDDFGSLVNKLSGRGGDFLDPILNDETLTGLGVSKTMQGLEWAYREGVSEPISTVNTVAGHAFNNPTANFADIFSGQTWGDAYEIAQDRSIGQSMVLAQGNLFGTVAPGSEVDPLDERAWKQVHKNAPFLSSVASGTSDFAARWYLDPGMLLGKGAKVARDAKYLRGIKESDFLGEGGIYAKSFEERNGVRLFADAVGPDHLGSRTENYLNFINTGAQGKPLNGAQVFVASPELQRSAAGRQVAGLLADASKIEDPATRGMAQRNILAVAWGDTEAIRRSQAELAEMGAVGDALKNVAKGNVLDLKTHALGEQILANPTLMASMDNQITAQADDIAKFVDAHINKLEALVGGSNDTGVINTLKYAPGVHKAGKRALAREEGKGILRDGQMATGPEAVRKPVNAALERAGRMKDYVATSSVYQRSSSHMPVKVITHTANAVARFGTFDYGRAPMRFADALRTSHLQGMVSTHDWNGAITQLDSMLKLGQVTPAERMTLLSKAQLARTESEKIALIHAVEKTSAKGLIAKHGVKQKIGSHAEMQDFVEEVMSKGQAKRAGQLSALYGRAYAATKNESADSLMRVDQIRPRADLIDDVDGAPVSLPLLETQGANNIPLFPAHAFDQALGREYGKMMKQAQAWQHARTKIGELERLKETTGRNVEKALRGYYMAMDYAVDAASWAMRSWKFSVLFRLGYPLRVISDDHMRIYSHLGAAPVWDGVRRESLRNIGYNQVTRYREAREAADKARVRLAEIDGLTSPEMVAAYQDRATQVASLNRKIAKAKSAGNQQRVDSLSIQRDVLQDAMGEDPAMLLAERAEREEFLSLSVKEQAKLKRKKRRGDREYKTKDGTVYPGAFGGDEGDAYRVASSSNATFDNLAKVSEERVFKDTSAEGGWRVIHADDPAHHVAWADVVNNQFRQSKVAMFFVKNEDATVDDFVRWIKQPEQKGLRDRLPHFAHDPEDWGWRVKQLVDDYLPTGELRELVGKQRVTPRKLQHMFPDISQRPAVHGATVSHNIGEMSRFATSVGRTVNNLYKYMGELPTDRLSRHPYFAAMYESEVQTLHARRMNYLKRQGEEFTQKDLDEITQTARKNALSDLRRTLFDISAHSNAAHMLRFVSPFFAAHQEALSRWWRIVGDDPSIIRRFQQGFDIPRKLGLVVDSETGEPVKDGEMPGPGHSILLQVPEAWGGSKTRLGKYINDKAAGWRVNENSFNLILQNGIMNPGIGPVVQVPVEAVVMEYAEESELERMARLLNPYPPESLGSMLLPATVRRVNTIIRKEKSSEYARMFSTNLQDKVVDFKLAHGDREPTQAEMVRIENDARNETNLEAWLRFGQNALSPAPAAPRSKYEVFRQGWRRINDQAEQQGQDYDWRIQKFRELYGDAYLPLIASTANNPGDLSATNETIGALKKHRKIIDSVDVRWAGSIVGAAGDYQSPEDYSSTAANWLRDNIQRDSEDPFYSYDNPLAAAREAAVKRGWNKYGQAVDMLNVMAVEKYGLQHYTQSDELMGLKRLLVQNLAEDNIYWGETYRDFNPGEFDSQLDDLRMIVKDKSLSGRRDVQTVGKYLQLRELFTGLLQRRDRLGGSADPGAKSNQDLMTKYRDMVAMLAESSPDFEKYWFNGHIDRDPMLDQTFFKE